VTSTELDASFLCGHVVGIGQDQDRDIAETIVGADSVHESQAVHSRQPYIEDYEVGLEPLCDRESSLAVGCGQHQVTLELELQPVHLNNCAIVFKRKHTPVVVGLRGSHPVAR